MQQQVITVIGAGTMGAGIAQTCAQSGFRTQLFDLDGTAATNALQRIDGFWQRAVEKGKATPEETDAWKAALTATEDLPAAVGGSDVVIEAVFEDLALKQRVFGELDDAAPDGALLSTNTSSLSIADIAGATSRPEAVLGMHFFNPVPLMPLLEIVRHNTVGDAFLERAQQLAAKLGKQHITVRDSPGFATSRLGIVLGNEAARMVEEGVASPADIDTAMRLGYGHPMGPLELSDLVGLDVRHNITQYLYEKLGGDQWKAPPLTERLVATGDLGKKTGAGFYDWGTGTRRDRDLPEAQ